MGFIELERRLKLLRGGLLIEMIEETINEQSDLIVRYNRNQLLEGLKADGSLMPEYMNYYNKKRSRTGRVMLYDTGDFHSMFWAQAANRKVSIFSQDVKTEILAGRYGNKIFGLTEENQNNFFKEIYPIIKQKIENFLAQ